VEQLAIPQGIPVLTKVDVADPDWVDLVEADLGERLADSPVRFGPSARVSSVTGTGIEELRERIRLAAPRIRRHDDLTRLPIDRAFSLAGVGTVVTGTLWSGILAVGDAVRLEPGG
jgi:selenocysteine-specific elongation factor